VAQVVVDLALVDQEVALLLTVPGQMA